MHGRIRNGRHGRWMPLAAEQYNVVSPPARLFYLNASMFGIPVQGYHRYVESAASMRVKAAALVPVVSAHGPEMTQSETVTIFNDMCVMAPATLIDQAIDWEGVDARIARARFTNAGHTIQAGLSFNDAGELTDFVSEDRYQISPDGKTSRRLRWSTPIRGYRPVQRAAALTASGRQRSTADMLPSLRNVKIVVSSAGVHPSSNLISASRFLRSTVQATAVTTGGRIEPIQMSTPSPSAAVVPFR
jgi:hypothetical protein